MRDCFFPRRKPTGKPAPVVPACLTTHSARGSDLIDRANEWLQEHPECEAKTVETILIDPVRQQGKDTPFVQNVQLHKNLFGVRYVSATDDSMTTNQIHVVTGSLWLNLRGEHQEPIQRLKSISIVPRLKISGQKHESFIENKDHLESMSSLTDVDFESVDELVEHLNHFLRHNLHLGTSGQQASARR